MRWLDVPVHVIDFEGNARTGVVEFGVVTLREGRIAGVVTRLCRPRSRLAKAEIAVHGLNEATLANSEPFENEWPLFAKLRETGVLAAHFSATEHALLRATWPVPRLSPDFLEPGRETAEWGPWLDTGRLAGERLRDLPSAALEDVVAALRLQPSLDHAAREWCPVDRRRFHCAAFDALASALVLVELAGNDDGEPLSLAQLLAWSTADPARRAARTQRELF